MLISPIKFIAIFAFKTIVRRFNIPPVFSTLFTSLTLRTISLITQFGAYPVLKALWRLRKVIAAFPIELIRNKLPGIPDHILEPILEIISAHFNDCIIMPKTLRSFDTLFLFLMSFKLIIPAGALLSRIVLIILGLSYISAPFASFIEMIRLYFFTAWKDFFSIINDAVESIKDYWDELWNKKIESPSYPVEPVDSLRKEYTPSDKPTTSSSASSPVKPEVQTFESIRKDYTYTTPTPVVTPEPVVLTPTFTLSLGDIFLIFFFGMFFMGIFETFYHDTIHYIPNKIGQGIHSVTTTISVWCQALYLTFFDPHAIPRPPATEPFGEGSLIDIDPWNIRLPSPTPNELLTPTGSLTPSGSSTTLSPSGSLTPTNQVTPRPNLVVLPVLPDLPEWPRRS